MKGGTHESPVVAEVLLIAPDLLLIFLPLIFLPSLPRLHLSPTWHELEQADGQQRASQRD